MRADDQGFKHMSHIRLKVSKIPWKNVYQKTLVGEIELPRKFVITAWSMVPDHPSGPAVELLS